MAAIKSAELEFVESARKLAREYRAKLAQLEGFISEWDGTEKSRAAVAAVAAIGDPTAKPVEHSTLNKPPASKADEPRTIPGCVRFVIQQRGDAGFIAPEIKSEIEKLHPDVAAEIKGTRISSELWRLAASGELVAEKVPGKPSIYRITDKFQPFVRFKRIV